MQKPDYINYSLTPSVAMPARIIPKIYYPSQDSGAGSNDRIVRFAIPKENAFWDPYSAFYKISLVPASATNATLMELENTVGSVPSTPNNFPVDIQTSALEYLSKIQVAYADNETSENPLGVDSFNQTTFLGALVSKKPSQSVCTDTCLQLDGSLYGIFNTVQVKSGATLVEDYREVDVNANFLRDMSYTIADKYGKRYLGMNSNMSLQTDFATGNTGIASGLNSSFYPLMLGGSRINVSNTNFSDAKGVSSAGNAKVMSILQAFSTVLAVPSTIARISEFSKSLSWKSNLATSGTTQLLATDVTDPQKISSVVFESIFDSDCSYSPEFSAGCNESMFTNIPISFIRNGAYVKNRVSTLDFLLPVWFSLFGILMPPDRYKFVPMHGLDKLEFELRQNDHAFFTSYYGTNFTDTRFKIAKMELHVNLIYYDDISLNNAVISTLFEGSGINISSCCWQFIQRFDFQLGVIKKELMCNTGFDSLKMLLFGILSSDYENATCYRKHFRLSHNISEFSVKMGKTYYPSLPIKGNASTSYGGGDYPDNGEFYYALMDAFGRGCNEMSSVLINQSNFAIDDRPYYFDDDDIAKVVENMKTLSLYSTDGSKWWNTLKAYCSLVKGPITTDPTQGFGTDGIVENGQEIFRFCGNSQWCHYWENKVVGRALFAIDFEQANYTQGIIGGFNTASFKPWLLEVKQQAPSKFKRNSEGYVFGYCDVSYQFKGGSIYRSGIN